MRPWIEKSGARSALAAAVPLAAAVLWAAWPAGGSPPAAEPAALQPEVPAAAPAPTEPAAPAAPSADGLVLHGLAGGGAIVGSASGAQRFVRIGREVLPGLTLVEVRQHHAVLRAPGGDVLLGFAGAAGSPDRALPQPASGGKGRHREEALRYQLGLEPREANGRIQGFVIRPDAQVPQLRAAGLRPGDLLVSVNGQALRSEERIAELAEDLATSFKAEFVFERGGRRMTADLAVKPQ